MSRIAISRRHRLTRTRAVKVANRVAEDVAAEYGVVATWIGDVAHLHGPGLSGSLMLARNHLHLELELGFVTTLFHEQIATVIETELDKLLEGEAKAAKKIGRTPDGDTEKRNRRNAKPPAEKLQKGARGQR